MHIVLIEPEIHWNTGNIGRTCVATGTTLHLVGKLGFSLEAKELKRAGLDYWPKLQLVQHADFAAFLAGLPPDPSLLLFTTKATKKFWDAPYQTDSYLVFGKESAGLPEDIRARFSDRLYRIPILAGERSMNLSNCAAVALFEGLRRCAYPGI
ncbi:MAG: tRNA (cytidine(34)-2'-O)-methyltransferase [Elusimicrobiota bacterium]|jgi:tRNA (cytidine/uridine-2'-O-)-methyltransferase